MNQRLLLFALLPAVLATLLAVGTGLWVVHMSLLPPPFAYLDADGVPAADAVATYQPVHTRLCAGDALRYTIGLDVRNTPVVISPFFKLLRVETGRALAGFGPLNPPVAYATPVRISETLGYTLPALMVPGPYELQVVAQSEGRNYNGFRVPFAVQPDCEKNR